ncbi:MAG: hypothetical protein JWM91_3551, partial [Rhodospirillales bacterium]|nr:hypothetical protein [Rhodospirillales bacterium]
ASIWASLRIALDPVLLKAVARGHRWFDELVSGRVESLEELAQRDGLKPRYVSRLMRLALLSPDIVEAITTNFRSNFEVTTGLPSRNNRTSQMIGRSLARLPDLRAPATTNIIEGGIVSGP